MTILSQYPGMAYFCNLSTQTNLTLPATSSVNDGFNFQIFVQNTTQVRLLMSAGDAISVGALSPAAGTGIHSTSKGSISLVKYGTTYYCSGYVGTWVSN
jgi:hypothetical protein